MTEAFYRVRDINNVREIIDTSTELFANRPAFEIKKNEKHINITYDEYRKDINALSSFLIKHGANDVRYAVLSDNCYEYCLTYISVICSGGVIVPIDKDLYPDDIRGILDVSETSYIFCDRKHLEKVKDAAASEIHIICFDLEDDGDGATAFSSVLQEGAQLIESGEKLWESVSQDTEKMCTLLFTSGTTGASKGIMLCQKNFIFEVKAAMGVLKIYPEDCGISLLPFHHTFESSIMIFFAPYCGAKVTFCGGFKYVLKNMKEYSPSVFVAVPVVLETVHNRILREIRKKRNGELKFKVGKFLCKSAAKLNIDLKKVIFKEIQDTFGGNMRMIICGGAAINPQIIKDFDAFGIQVVYGYGLTECAPLAVINHDRLRSTDSIGEPLPGVEAKLVDCDSNGIGELCVKGGMVMLGYYKNPEETAEVIDKDGFLHTGDLCFIDKQGRYHIAGRCKNVIVTSNGKNIYPEELEYHLDSHQFVNSSLVESKKDGDFDEKIVAQLYPDIDEMTAYYGRKPTEEEIDSAMKEAVENTNSKVPSFKKISSFTVRRHDFIRTTAQKIKRNENKN